MSAATLGSLSCEPGTFLVCEEAGPGHGEWSADPRDYAWWMSEESRFLCAECGADMVEVRRSVTLEPVAWGGAE